MKINYPTLAIFFLMLSTSIFTITVKASEEGVNALPAILPLLLNSSDNMNCPEVNGGPTIVTDNFPGTNDPDVISQFFFDEDLEMLVGATKVEGSIFLQIGDLPGEINSNSDLSVFDSLVEVTGGIRLQIGTNDTNTVLETIDIFPCLEVIGADLSIGDQEISFDTRLKELAGFDNLKSAGSLFIDGHNDLEQIPLFPNLEVLGGIYILENPSLSSIQGFDSLQQTPSTSIFINNSNLGCSNVTENILPATISTGNLENLVQCP